MSKNDGGAAFPFGESRYDGGNHYLGKQYWPGMSLRDWFAGQALIGLLSGQYSRNGGANLKEVPEEAYKIADALLTARDAQ